jgi:hypothetical protein
MLGPARRSLVLVVIVLLAPACGGKKTLPKGKLEGLAKTAVAQVPEDTAVMFGISWSNAKESRLYPKIVETMQKEPETAGRLATLEEVCGLDLRRELDSIVVANNAEMQEKTAVVFLKGNWDETHANECVSAYWEKKFFHKIVASKEGNLTTYAVDGENPKMYAWWPTPDTAILAPKNLRERTFLTEFVGGQSSVKNNKAFMELLERVDTTATWWLAMSGTSNPGFQNAFAQVIEGGDARPLGLYASVDISNGLLAVIGLRFGAERDAKAIAQKAQGELRAAQDDEDYKKYLRRVSIKTIDKDVVVKAELDENDLEELVTAFEEYLPTLGRYIKENI